MIGITLGHAPGLGDKLQFSSFPENYYRNTGDMVIDLDSSWIFDYNPFVVRGKTPTQVVDLWEQPWPHRSGGLKAQEFIRKPIFFSQAERTASIFGHTAYLRHPRLYRFEDIQINDKRLILHTTGKRTAAIHTAQGEDHERILTEDILAHIRRRFCTHDIIQIGGDDDLDARVIDNRGLDNIWDVIKLIAQSSMFIGVDSGPSWLAACYPHIFKKKILMQYPIEFLRSTFVPMHRLHFHQHWHDASFIYYNRSSDDAGVTYSYLKL